MKKIILTLAVLTIGIASCKKDNQDSFKLDSTTLTLKVGERHQFVISKGEKVYSVELFDWRSSDMAIGNVNASGQIQAAAEGKVTVTAQYGSSVAKCNVTVVK